MDINLADILKKSEFTREDMNYLLTLHRDDDLSLLFQKAERVRRRYCGNTIFLRGIVEFSNYCRRNCRYCGLRRGNSHLPRYRLRTDEIIETAIYIESLGIKTIVLQSGEDPHFDAKWVELIIREIKRYTALAITLSIGERSGEEYQRWFDAGADRYLLKHETSQPALYQSLHPDMLFMERIRCLGDLREIGYQVGSGFMTGLPGQPPEDIADEILFLKNLNVDMAGIGPFISNPRTPLARNPSGSKPMALKALAIARIVLKDVHLPATTALETLEPGARMDALKCGANVLMLNFTPQKYRLQYEIYPNLRKAEEDSLQILNTITSEIESLGRKVGYERGDSLKLAAPMPVGLI